MNFTIKLETKAYCEKCGEELGIDLTSRNNQHRIIVSECEGCKKIRKREKLDLLNKIKELRSENNDLKNTENAGISLSEINPVYSKLFDILCNKWSRIDKIT